MVKLKSLELSGFKSFADKTRLVFSDGITAVIGPNGCGKSNLSDALGWVLGAQSAKSLRGQRMEDFIFGGTKKRKPSGLAEVTLSFSRTSDEPIKIDGIEVTGTEFDITRKLYRSGESIYLINNRRCRLMDIQDFLEHGGLGFASYAMIAQGRIDSFLTAKPLDRRAIIEEAAQIIGYKSKRKNAELKLEMAQQNLLRVNDIVVEVERQLRSLKRQASKAKVYKKLKEEYRRVQRLRLKFESDRLSGELSRLSRQLGDVKEVETLMAKRLADEESAFREKSQTREALETRLTELRARRSANELELDRAENSARYSRQQREEVRLSLHSLAGERQALIESLALLRDELGGYVAQEARLRQDEEAAVEQVHAAQARVRDCSARLEALESRLEDLRSRLIAATAEAASLRNLREQLSQRVSRIDTERTRLSQELGQGQKSLKDARSLEGARRERLGNRRERLAEVEVELQQVRERVRSVTEQLQTLVEEETQINNQLVAINERLQSLQELEISRSHYSDSVRSVLGHLTRSQSIGIAGTLSDSIETEAEFEKLVEEFLDEELEYILVDSLDEAVRGVSEVRTLKSGKCTFLSIFSTNGFGKGPVTTSPQNLPDRSQGVYGTLASVLKMKPEIGEAFCRVLPKQADAIVVSDMDRAMGLSHSYPESTFITLNGESLTPRGLVSSSAAGPSKIGLLGLKRQRRELEKRCESQQKARALAMKRREAKELELNDAKARFEELQSLRHQLEMEVVGLGHEHEQAEAEVRRQERLLEANRQESDQLEVELCEVQARLEGLTVNLAAQETIQAEAGTELKVGRESQSDMRDLLARHQEEANAAVSQRRVLEERRISISGTVSRIQAQEKEAAHRLEVIGKRESDSQARIDELEAAIGTLDSSVVRRKEDRGAIELQLEELQERYQQCREVLRNQEREVADIRERCNVLSEERSKAEVDLARIETQLQNLEDHCQDQLNLSLAAAILDVEVEETAESEVKGRYEQLKRRIESFGPINMTALQEYQENLERHTFLTQQRADIEKSISDTMSAIQEINRRSRARFTEAFEAVNRNFKEVFQKLFGGGECGMMLLDDEDVLEAGIDVYAQPPGKRLQNVMLLSGGEKALTVFALLVGIFMYRPSRFCVLDEVDAPLDDANVQRFNGLIGEMGKEIQFIVVTHNKRTMEASDTMYGITMEDPGISKVVSARF